MEVLVGRERSAAGDTGAERDRNARDAKLLELMLRLGREDSDALDALILFLSRAVHE